MYFHDLYNPPFSAFPFFLSLSLPLSLPIPLPHLLFLPLRFSSLLPSSPPYLSPSFSFPFFTDIDIKISWFAKLLEAMTQTDPATGGSVANYANICTALDLLAFLLQVGTN